MELLTFAFKILLALLPFFALLATIFTFIKYKNDNYNAIIKGSIFWGLTIVIITNFLSFFNLIDRTSLAIFWSAYTIISAYLSREAIKQWPKKIRITYALVLLFVILVTTLFTALVYPPNNADSMAYHMPKIMHWMNNKSIEHYITDVVRQNGLAPFAEMAILQNYVLIKTDIFANIIQWLAFVGIIIVTAATAKELGSQKKGQLAAAIFIATLPMAIAQATSTQTDNVVAFWLCCMANRFLLWKNNQVISNTIFFGSALGLAILTKGSAYPIALPFVFLFAYYAFKNFKKVFIQGLVAAVLVIVINAPHLTRNYTYYNNIFAGGIINIIEKPSVNILCANIVANLLSNDPGIVFKTQIESLYEKILEALNVNPQNRQIFPYGGISERAKFTSHEDFAQNPLHTIFLLIIFIQFALRRKFLPGLYTGVVFASILAFSTLLTWQPWITRLQVPLFALCAPLFGIAYERYQAKHLQQFLLICLAVGTIPSLFLNASRPLVPNGLLHSKMTVWQNTRDELYFTNGRTVNKERYIDSVNYLAKVKPESIGLVVHGNLWEYPLWAILTARWGRIPQIVHTPNIETLHAKKPAYVFVEGSMFGEEKPVEQPYRVFKHENDKYIQVF